MAIKTINGYHLVRKSDNAEIERWEFVPYSIVLPTATYFNIPANFDIPDYRIEPTSWNITIPDAPTTAEIIDEVFPQTGVAKALFEAIFEIVNRLQSIESKPSITRSQLRAWFIAKAE